MNPYEVLLMLDPELADERQNEILGRAEEIVTQGGGVWHGNEPWGRRKLAYEIDNKNEGALPPASPSTASRRRSTS